MCFNSHHPIQSKQPGPEVLGALGASPTRWVYIFMASAIGDLFVEILIGNRGKMPSKNSANNFRSYGFPIIIRRCPRSKHI